MKATVHKLTFSGKLLERGFWLYVWEITTPENKTLYYVGRTGDSSSNHAQSPFNRMGQHLAFNNSSNMLRRHLENKNIVPEKCGFRLVAYGPVLEEAATQDDHRKSRDITAGLEKALAEALKLSGYDVLNQVNCRKAPNPNRWHKVRNAFAEHFPKLNPATIIINGNKAVMATFTKGECFKVSSSDK